MLKCSFMINMNIYWIYNLILCNKVRDKVAEQESKLPKSAPKINLRPFRLSLQKTLDVEETNWFTDKHNIPQVTYFEPEFLPGRVGPVVNSTRRMGFWSEDPIRLGRISGRKRSIWTIFFQGFPFRVRISSRSDQFWTPLAEADQIPDRPREIPTEKSRPGKFHF